MKFVTVKSNKAVLGILAGITFLGFIDTVLLLPIIALYAESLGASVGIAGLVVGLYSITNTPANIIFGRLIDRVGTKIPLIAGLLGSAISLFLYSLCRIPLHLGLVRISHGVSGGMIGPATMSSLSDCASEGKRGRVMGIYGMAIAAAHMVGYPLSGVVAINWGYSAVFYVASGLLFIGALAAVSLPGYKFDRCRQYGRPATSFGHVFSLVKRPGLRVAYITIIALYFSFGGLITLLPFHLSEYGYSAMHMGILLGIFSVFFILFQVPIGRLGDRIGRFKPAALGLLISFIALLFLPFLNNIVLMAAAMAFFGISFGMIFPSASSLIIDFSSEEERGICSGVYHAFLTVGVALGAPLAGGVGQWLGVQAGLLACAAVIIFPLVAALESLHNAPRY